MSSIFRFGWLLWLMFIVGCSSNEVTYPQINEDFCAQTHLDSNHVLSTQLDPFKDVMNIKTGVYTLEEGENSMIARAWLTESAEKTIDIQYFIFSADNIGLIAIDYLLRAADRGVKVRMLVDDIMVEADAEDLMALDAHPNLSIKKFITRLLILVKTSLQNCTAWQEIFRDLTNGCITKPLLLIVRWL